MPIKLLALDLDGTALGEDHSTLSAANCAAIHAAIDAGIEVVLATGRMRGRIPEQLEAIREIRYWVTSNGAAVYDRHTGQVLYLNALSTDTTRTVLQTMAAFPFYLEIYCDGYSYTENARIAAAERFPIRPWQARMMPRARRIVDSLYHWLEQAHEPVGIEKIHMPYIPPMFLDDVWQALRALKGVKLVSSLPSNCEINSESCNKADGLSQLCRHLGILPGEVMAMGDNENDTEMMEYAGLAVAPGNSTEEIKALAHAVVADCDHDAVAQAIRQFLPVR